jgi:type VI secretion system protein ImpC
MRGDARDRIRFNPNDRPEVPATPLRLAVIADLANTGAELALRKVRVDKDTFNEVLRSICPRIRIQIESSTSPATAPIIAEFPVQDLKSFAPPQLAGAPLFRDLSEDRSAAADLRDGKLSPDEFKRRVKSDLLRGAVDGLQQETHHVMAAPVAPEPPRAADAGREDVLDSILSMVDSPAGSLPAAPTDGAARVQSFIADMFGGGRPPSSIDRARAGAVVKDIEATIASRMNEVLGNPEFSRLESGWRGLKFLVDRTDFRDGIEIELILARKDQLVSRLEEVLADMDSGTPGYDAVLAGFEFRNTPEDLDIVRRASELASDLRTPVLVSVGARFFGFKSASDVTRIPHLRAHLDGPEFVKWESFRAVESSRWLGAGFNRFLLRNRYDSQSVRLPFAFQEVGDGLWGDPVWALGTLLARSFSRTGWCGHITGVRGGGALEDLPVREFELPSGDVRNIPLESVFLRGREDDFYQAGFLVLQCGEDQDLAALLDCPTVHRPEKYSDTRESQESRHRSRLCYQLVAGRLARFVEREIARLGGLSAAEIQRDLESSLRRFVPAADSVEVRLAESQERVGYYDLSIRVRPGSSIWPLAVSIDFNVPLRRN